MVEETVYDDVVQCDHSYDKRCHTTYITNYETQQEEECDENYRKSCFIEYQQVSSSLIFHLSTFEYVLSLRLMKMLKSAEDLW